MTGYSGMIVFTFFVQIPRKT